MDEDKTRGEFLNEVRGGDNLYLWWGRLGIGGWDGVSGGDEVADAAFFGGGDEVPEGLGGGGPGLGGGGGEGLGGI